MTAQVLWAIRDKMQAEKTEAKNRPARYGILDLIGYGQRAHQGEGGGEGVQVERIVAEGIACRAGREE